MKSYLSPQILKKKKADNFSSSVKSCFSMRTYKFKNLDNSLIQKTKSFLEANFLDPNAILLSFFFSQFNLLKNRWQSFDSSPSQIVPIICLQR